MLDELAIGLAEAGRELGEPEHVICSSRSAVVSAGGRRGEHITVARAEAPSGTGGALG